MMPAIPWWICAGLAAAIAGAEIHLPGGYFVWIAVGVTLTAAATAGGVVSTLEAQLGVFVVATVFSCCAGYYIYGYRGFPGYKNRLNRRNLLMVGDRGVVSVPIINGRGKVRLGDSVWIAEGPELGVGTPVVVTAVRGTCVIVEAAR